MTSSLLPALQKYLRGNSAPRQLVRSPQYDEQSGFGSDAEPRLSSAKLIESPMRAIPVGECAIADNQFGYFMDGIQRSWLLYYQNFVPVYYGYVAAVVRQRQEAILSTWEYINREAIYIPQICFDQTELEHLQSQKLSVVDTSASITVDSDLAMQPLALRELARNEITVARERLEAELAKVWIEKKQANWLVMDGSITISPYTAEHPRIVGLIKSHNTQYFKFPEQEIILNLKFGERSATFTPRGRHQICSWYLRLRSGTGEDLHFGLVRVEASLAAKKQVDEISRWIMTERRPLSLPDSRWDKMIYPIRDCEQFLRSKEPSRVSFGWLN